MRLTKFLLPIASALLFCAAFQSQAQIALTTPEPPRSVPNVAYNPPTGGTAWSPTDGTSLQAALTGSAPGDVITVCPSSYSNVLSIPGTTDLTPGSNPEDDLGAHFVAPAKANPSSKWLYVLGCGLSHLPADTSRIHPVTANVSGVSITSNVVTLTYTLTSDLNFNNGEAVNLAGFSGASFLNGWQTLTSAPVQVGGTNLYTVVPQYTVTFAFTHANYSGTESAATSTSNDEYYLVKITSPDGAAALGFPTGSNFWRFRGFDINSTSTSGVGAPYMRGSMAFLVLEVGDGYQGNRSVTVTTGAQVAQADLAFMIDDKPWFEMSPSTIAAGAGPTVVTITGHGTHLCILSGGVCTVTPKLILGVQALYGNAADVTIGTVTPTSDTAATVTVTPTATASLALGLHYATLVVDTPGGVGTCTVTNCRERSAFMGGFQITGGPTIASITPSTGAQSASGLHIKILFSNTVHVGSTSKCGYVFPITSAGCTYNASDGSLNDVINIPYYAFAAPFTVNVVTPTGGVQGDGPISEVAQAYNGFTVIPTGACYVTSVTPNHEAPGFTGNVVITGSAACAWTTGSSVASFNWGSSGSMSPNGGVTINSSVANTGQQLTVNITVASGLTGADAGSSNIILDQVRIHGANGTYAQDSTTGIWTTTGAQEVIQGVHADAANGAIINSVIEQIHNSFDDSQGIGFSYNLGPFLIDNNYLSAVTEVTMSGGTATRQATPSDPADVTITNNHYAKPFSWIPFSTHNTPLNTAATVTVSSLGVVTAVVPSPGGHGFQQCPNTTISTTVGSGFNITGCTLNGSGTITAFTFTGGSGYSQSSPPVVGFYWNEIWIVKDHSEMKSGQRWSIQGNVYDHNWNAYWIGGNCTIYTPRVGENQGSVRTTVENVLFENNICNLIGTGIVHEAWDDQARPQYSPDAANGTMWAGTVDRLNFINNLFVFEDWTDPASPPNREMETTQYSQQNELFSHNTGVMRYGASTQQMDRAYYFDNMGQCGSGGWNTNNLWFQDNLVGGQPAGECEYPMPTGINPDWMGNPSISPNDSTHRYSGNFGLQLSGTVFTIPGWGSTSNPVTTSNMTFVNPSAGNFQLLSPVESGHTNSGTQPGIDYTTLQNATSYAVSGVPSLTPTINSTSPLPSGTVGTYYSDPLSASGGLAPYTWAATGGALPAGLTLTSGGIVQGTPTAAGTAGFTVTVTDSNLATASATFTLVIDSPLSITTTSPLPSALVGVFYSTAISGAGGGAPYAWSIIVSILPAGLGLNNSTGVISGTPTVAGTPSFTVKLADAMGDTPASKTFSMTISAASTVATPVLSTGTGTYPTTLSITLTDGTFGAVICYTTDGSTPLASTPGTCSHGTTYSAPVPITVTGTELQAIGTLSGDVNSAIASATYTLTVSPAPIFVPAAGTYAGGQTVTISDSDSGTIAIYYNTTGAPTCGGSTLYTAPVTVATSETLYAIACETNFNPSSVASAAYTITPLAVSQTLSAQTLGGQQSLH